MTVLCTPDELQGSESSHDEELRKLRIAMMTRHSKESRPNDEVLLEGYVTVLQGSHAWKMDKYQHDKMRGNNGQFELEQITWGLGN